MPGNDNVMTLCKHKGEVGSPCIAEGHCQQRRSVTDLPRLGAPEWLLQCCLHLQTMHK